MNKLYFKTKNSALLCLLLISTVLFGNLFTADAQVKVPFTQRASSTAPFTKNYKIKGDFTLMGNTNLTLQSYSNDDDNSNNSMVYVDIDGDPNTLNSSSATLVLPTDDGVASNCSNIVFAGLYWTGRASNGSQSNNTFSVSKDITTGNTVTQNTTDENRRIYNSSSDIANTDYKLTITRSGTNNNRTITYTFTTTGAGNTQTFVYAYNNGNETLTRNGSNVPTSSIDNDDAYLTTPYTIFSNSTYTLKLNRLRRDGRNSNIDSPTSAYVDVTYKTTVPEVITVTKNFDKSKISLKGPGDGNYTTISANLNGSNNEIYYPTNSDGFMYSAYADVTNFVKSRGIGEYTAADIALVEGDGGSTGYYGGWSMIVIYENSNMKNRDITVFDGHAYVTGGTADFNIDVAGFNAVQTGDVGIKLGLVAGEGDKNISGDYFKIQKLNTTNYQSLNHTGNSETNFFNSSIQTGGNAKNPNYVNNTGLDISMFKIPNAGNTVIGNNQTSTKFNYGSTQDTYVIFALAMSVDAYVPEIEGVITATSIDGSSVVGSGPYTALPGQELGYKVQIKNKGTEIINNSKIVIPVPYNATYVENSASKTINFTPLPTPNTLTFDPTLGANGSIVWNIGSLPLPANPNTVLAELTFKFKVTENCTLLKNTNCSNTISVNGLMNGIGNTSSVNITDKSFIQGYATSGNCQGNVIAAPIETTINATDYINTQCQSTPPITAFTFCNAGTTIPISNIAGAFPPGSTFYDSLAKTNQYTTNNPFPATVGTKTYYAIPAGVTSGCYFEFTINVTSITSAPTVANVKYCVGQTASPLTATKSNNAYTLYYYTSTTSSAQSSITPLTDVVGETTYYVAEGQSNSCIGPKVPIVVTVNENPAAPTNPVDVTVCESGAEQTLTATATVPQGYTITWYDAPTGGNVVSPATLVSTTAATKTLYAQASNETCSSLTRTAVTLTINALPGTPSVNNLVYCQDEIAQPLSATASNSSNTLYYFETLTSTPQSSITPSTNVAGEFTYYVAEESNSCFGPKKAIAVLIHPKTIINSQPVNQNIVYGNNATFSVTASNVTAYQWQIKTDSEFIDITDNTIYSNTNTATLTINNPNVSMNSYSYRAVLKGTGDCPDVITNPASLTVTPKEVTVVADNKTKVYGEMNPELTAVVTGAVNGDVINYTLATTAEQFSPVATYPIVVTLGNNPNYTVSKTDATLTITPKSLDVTVVADNKTKVYGEMNPELTAVVTGAVNGDVINYTLATTAEQFSPVATYPIVVTLGNNPNYTVSKTDGTLTITPKSLDVTVVADNKTKVYGEMNPELTAVVTGAVNGDVINYTLATTAEQFSPVATYPIVVTLGNNPNYTVSKTDGTLTITPKSLDVTVVADNKTKVYGEMNPELTAVVTGAVNGDVINYTLATTAEQFSPVATYPIVVTLGNNPNYTVSKTDGTLTITPKSLDVTVVADNKTKVYGEMNPELTAVVTGAVNGDVINYTLATTAEQFSPVATYPIVVTLGNNPNYTVSKTDGTLTITPKSLDVTVVADNKTKVYGEMNPELTAVVTGAVNGDVINYTLATTAEQFSPVATYPIVVTLGNNPNYTVSKTDATLTITPKSLDVTVVADNKTKVYGEMNPELTAVVTGAVNGDVINYTLATTAEQFSPVATYPIVVTLGNNPNYTVSKTDGTLTITPKSLDVTVVADNKTKVYGEMNPELTAVVTGAVNGDVINYTLATTAEQFSPVATYPIVVTLGNNPNYTVSKTDGTLTITPKSLDVTVVADNKTKVYGEMNPELTAVVTGAVNGDVINYTLATTAEQFSPVDTYPIVVTLGNNPNYTVSKTDGTLTITPKSLDVTVVADNKTKVYGEMNPELTAVVTGAVNGDVINYTLATTAEQFSPVDTYPIVVTLGNNPNYTVSKTDATLTITPKSLDVTVVADNKTKVYGEMNPELTAVVTGAVNGDVINYTLATTAEQFSPVDTYPIVVTLGNNPNYTVSKTDGTLTITPKSLDVTVVADNKTKVYGEMNPELTAVVTGAVNGDVINYTLATTAEQFSPVATYPIVVTLGNNPNYTVSKTDATLTITPKSLDVTVVADNKTKVYGEMNPELTAVVTGAVNGDVINYTLATTAEQFSPVATYPIVVTLGNNPNYTVSKTDATLTITPKSLDVTVVADNKTKVYGEMNPELTAVVTGAVNGDVINYTLATTAEQFSPVATYPIVVTLGNNPNYTVSKTDGTLTITPKSLDVTVVADNKTKVYGEMNPELTAVVTGAVNGDVINYTLATTAEQFSPVATYPIVVTLGNNPNYTVSKTDGTLTITPKSLDVTVVADNKTKVYGEMNPELTAVVTGAVNGDVINYTLATTAEQFSPVDTYPIVVTLGNNPNYTVSKTDGTLTITPKSLDVTVVADNKTKVYGEMNPELTAVVTGAVNGDVINYTLATTAEQFSPVDTYPIVVTLGNNPNYTVSKTDGTLTITPKSLDVTVVADNKTKVYGEMNPELTAVVTGAVNGDVINYTLATTAEQFSPVDTYPIVVTLGNNPNYTVSKTDGTLTITPKSLDVTVVADNKTKVYGEMNPELTAVVTGAVNGDVINYTLATTAEQFSPVATYPIVVTLGNNPNYTVSKTDGTLTITPKSLDVTVVADNKTKVYGEMNPELTAVVTGAVNGDVINYTLATTAEQFSPVATYPIVVTLGNNPNYTVSKTDATLTITPKSLDVTVVADNKTKVYGEMNPELTAVVTGAVNGDVINYTLATTAEQFSPVATYPIVVTLGNNPNYTVSKTDGTLTITPKSLDVTVVADNKTKVYGEMNPELTAVVTGAVNGDVINYTLATTAEQFSPVATYPIVVTLGNNPNYTVSKTDGTLTITPKSLDVTVVADNKTKVYGEMNPELTAVVTGAVNGDVINYTLATTAEQFSPVDTYPIVVTLGNNPNYTVSKTDGTLTITPKSLDVTVVADNKTKVYGEMNPELTAVVTGAVNGDVINYTLATTAEQFSPVDTYPIVVTLGNNPNYTVSKTDATLTITPKSLDVTVVADNKTKVYGEMNPELTAVVTGAVNGDVINYTLATTAEQFSPVDTYPIVVTLGNNPNYTVSKTDATLTITPKSLDVTVVADNKTKVYGEMNPELTAVVTGAVNGDVINYTLATTAEQFSPVDTYPIVVTLGNNPNYTVSKTDGTLTITPKSLDVTVVADNKTKVYGEMNPELTAVVTGAVNGDVINYTLATTAEQFSPVATYPIVVTLGNNPNYTVSKTDGTLTITPKSLDVTVVADNKTKVYGEMNPELTAVVTGAVNGDVINYTLATTAEQFSPVATYPIVVTLGNNPNYTVSKTDGTLTITPKSLDVTVVADNKTKVYGEMNPELTAVVTGAVNGDVINYTLATTAEQFSPVATYPIVVTLGNNPNYTVSKTDGTLTITPKSLDVTVVADNKTKVYGEMNPELTAVVTGAVNGDVINYTLATTAEQFSPVATYPIVVTLGNNPNYTVSKTDATLTITPKSLDVTVVADNKTKVYGEMNPELTAVVTGAVNGDVINYTLATTAEQFSPVATYPIVVTLGNNPNYTVSKTDATLTITPKSLDVTVVADNKTKVYGEMNPELTAVVTGAVNGDVINYTLATTAEQFSPVATYPIVVTLGNNPNYTVSKTDGTLTITSSAIDANDDIAGPINGINGGNAGINILSNDYLNGSIVNPAEITITFVNSNNPGITLVGTDINIAPGIPAGNYELVYKICENININTNCDNAIVKISVYTPSISINKDGSYVDSNNDGKTNVGDQIKYTFAVKNTGGSKLTNITITDNKVTVLGGPIDLNVDESDTTTFSAIYNITQEDINKGVVYNLAIAKGTPPVGDPVTATSTDPTPCTTCPKDPECTDCTITEVPQNPGISITKDGTYVDANNDGKTNIGDVVSYKFVITNTGNVTLTNVTVTDNNATVTGGPIATLAPGATDATTFTASHTITQDDINKGIVYNLATATAKDPKDNPVTATSTDPTPCTTCPKDPECTDCTITEVPQNPGISITKDGTYVDANNDGKTNIGDVVSYKFVITNTGNVTLTNVTVTDNNATVTGGPIATLAPGATDATTFTASHAITQDDINKGIVYNLATATAKDPKDNPVTATSTDPTPCTTCPKDPECTDCTITEVPQNAGLTVNKTATVTSNNTQTDVYSFVGDVINYTINVINTGNVTINNIIVKDPLTGLDTTNQSFSLLPGENKEFTQSLTVTLADLNNESITNIATASGLTPNNNPVEAEDTVIVERAGVLGCGTIEVHNAFTPNGDGTNDNFVIDNITDTTCYPENTVEIYNRWGILVYETKGYDNVNNAFKGYSEGRVTVDKSTGLPAGTYFYILNYTAVGLQGEIIPKREQGYLYLTR